MMGDPIPSYAANFFSSSSSTFTTSMEQENAPLDVDDTEFSATVLNYLDQMLMEEDDMNSSSMFHDSLALQATENSFYDLISSSSSSSSSTQQHHLLNNYYPNVDSPEDSFSCSFSDYATNTTNTSTNSPEYTYTNPSSIIPITTSPLIPPPPPLPNFTEFLMNNTTTTFSPSFHTSHSPQLLIKTEFDHEAQQQDYHQNYSADDDGSELSELFNKVLLGTGLGNRFIRRKQDSYNEEGEVVDLRKLLMQCAQAISCDNPSFAKVLLAQIRKHSSPTGGGTQRLAHCFANALEARIAGTATCNTYGALSSKRTTSPSPADMVKAYKVHDSACPFDKLAIIFAINSICNVAKGKDTLHVVDFGIRYGFKWPGLIYKLSKRDGGPPKLRITGIELPQPGLKLEERWRTLAMYCKRFNVPFEFNAIVSKNWETIKVENLKINKNECLAVNCMFRFENLLDETVVPDNPRDAVLNLIREVNLSIFVHGIVNGSYDAAFFETRFKEALFHYSALFDMLDANVDRGDDDPMRLVFEEELFGREVLNVIACEGCERVVRPHKYKRRKVRNMRCGFREIPLDQVTVEKMKGRLRDDGYHSDFMVHVDGNWVLQGWKGRILHASSCWVPA